MSISLVILIVALVLYEITAAHPRHFGLSADLTAIGLGLVCFTMLVVSGIL